jgi:hypothetical protein
MAGQITEFGLRRIESPRGGSYFPFMGATDPNPNAAFPKDIRILFQRAVESGELAGKLLLTHIKRGKIRMWLARPSYVDTSLTKEERRKEASEKHHYLTHFQDSEGQVYRKPTDEKSYYLGPRYAACTYDAGELIALVHVKLHHARKSHDPHGDHGMLTGRRG